MAETKLGVVFCHSCDSNHQDIEAKEYKGQRPGPYTHWLVCPNTGDAVPLTIATAEGVDTVINQKVMAMVSEAQANERYMVATFIPIENSNTGHAHVKVFQLTNEFPVSHTKVAVEALTTLLDREVGPPQDEPMKAASLPDSDEPLSRLFGNSRKLPN